MVDLEERVMAEEGIEVVEEHSKAGADTEPYSTFGIL